MILWKEHWTNEWIGVILPDFWFSLLEKIRIIITNLFTLLIMWTMRRNISANNIFWAQIHNQSLAAIFERGLSYTLHIREKLQAGLPSLLHGVPAY